MFLFEIVFSSVLIGACLWIGITSAIGAYRHHEWVLALLAASAILLGGGQAIPFANLLIGGLGDEMDMWLMIDFVVFLLAAMGLATFNMVNGVTRLRRKGLSLRRILLGRSGVADKGR